MEVGPRERERTGTAARLIGHRAELGVGAAQQPLPVGGTGAHSPSPASTTPKPSRRNTPIELPHTARSSSPTSTLHVSDPFSEG
jgi:hypothetical protein